MARKLKKTTSSRLVKRVKRKMRTRKNTWGTEENPRMCVTKSNKMLRIQLINDEAGKTILSLASDRSKTVNCSSAETFGKMFAEKAKSQGFSKVQFDRSGQLYHGKIAALAAGARSGGLNF